MSRLILFSGGVESTALLTLAQPGDIVLSVLAYGERNTYEFGVPHAIGEAMGLKVQYACVEARGKSPNGRATYQLHWLLAVAGVRVAQDAHITEVWYGLHIGEPHEPWAAKQLHERLRPMWEAWHPEVRLRFPLYHLTKAEQWELIPDKVKPLVRNCSYVNDCGSCAKCRELKALPGSFWSNREAR